MLTLLLCIACTVIAAAAGWLLRDRTLRARCADLQSRIDMADRALSSAGAGMFVVDARRNRIHCSQSTLVLRGLPHLAGTDVSFEEWISVVHQADRGNVQRLVEENRRNPNFTASEYRICMPDGQQRWARVYAEPHRRASDGAQMVYGLMLDITHVKNLQAQVRARDERLRDACKAASLYTWELRLQDMRFTVDRPTPPGPDGEPPEAIFQTFESSPEDLIAMHHPEDRDRLRAMIEKVRQEDVPYEMEGRLVRPNGTYCWTLALGDVVRDPVTGARKVCGTAQDIDSRKKAELRFLEAEARLERAVRGANDGLWEIDAETRRVWVSERFAEILGYQQEAFSSDLDLLPKITHPEDREVIIKAIGTHLAGGPPIDAEIRYQASNGEWRWCRMRGMCERDADGKTVKVSGSQQDVTERRQYQEALISATEAAAAASQAKSDFLANMSHEIRTPMNGVLGMTELLLETRLDSTQRDYATTVRDSATALLTVINDILDFSKVEAGKLELESIDFDLRDTMEDVARLISIQAHAKQLEITALIDPQVPDLVQGDAGRLRQILLNLGGNAVKFTQRGEVAISASVVQRLADRMLIRCEVRDTGIGIPASRLQALFQPFTQVDASTTRRFGGSGLGLSIVKRLAELMEGDAGVISEEGCGSTFWFTAKLGVAVKPNMLRPASPSLLCGQSVLVVDDNATNRKVLSGQLERCGMHPVCVSSAEEALVEMRTAHEAGRSYEIALLDHQMPVCDGADLGRQIVADQHLNTTRLVLLTSSGQRGDSNLFASIGFAGYLLKPVGQRDLIECLMLVMGAQAQAWHMRSQPIVTRHALRSKRLGDKPHILLAEDNPVNQKVACRTLEKLGYRVDVARDGRAAVTAWESGRYSLILMDCQMPVLDGYEATREIRRREAGERRIPIVALTAHAMKGADVECKAAGMDEHLTKPINREALAACLHRFLNDVGGGEVASEQEVEESTRG